MSVQQVQQKSIPGCELRIPNPSAQQYHNENLSDDIFKNIDNLSLDDKVLYETSQDLFASLVSKFNPNQQAIKQLRIRKVLCGDLDYNSERLLNMLSEIDVLRKIVACQVYNSQNYMVSKELNNIHICAKDIFHE